MKRILNCLLALVLVLSLGTPAALAAGTVIIDDQADLLTAEEESKLQADYAGILEYMDVAFVSRDVVSGSTESYARSYVNGNFGSGPASIFFIDMDNREIYIFSNAAGLRILNKADARAITDNIYKLASAGNYYGCADQAFSQMLAKCRGEKLARPVKHITNAMIAVLFGILLNYFVVAWSRKPRKERQTQGLEKLSPVRQMAVMPGILLAAPIVIASRRVSRNSGSGGSGGGGGGGGGHSF